MAVPTRAKRYLPSSTCIHDEDFCFQIVKDLGALKDLPGSEIQQMDSYVSQSSTGWPDTYLPLAGRLWTRCRVSPTVGLRICWRNSTAAISIWIIPQPITNNLQTRRLILNARIEASEFSPPSSRSGVVESHFRKKGFGFPPPAPEVWLCLS